MIVALSHNVLQVARSSLAMRRNPRKQKFCPGMMEVGSLKGTGRHLRYWASVKQRRALHVSLIFTACTEVLG